MDIYIVEFEGSTKGSYQRAYTNIDDLYNDWLEFKERVEEYWEYNSEKFLHMAKESWPANNLVIGDQDLYFTIRFVDENHIVGPRTKVIFDENKNLVRVSLKRVVRREEGYNSLRSIVAKRYEQYTTKRGKIIIPYKEC